MLCVYYKVSAWYDNIEAILHRVHLCCVYIIKFLRGTIILRLFCLGFTCAVLRGELWFK